MNKFTIYIAVNDPHGLVEGIAAILNENSPLTAIEQFTKSPSGWAEMGDQFIFKNSVLQDKADGMKFAPTFSCYLPLTDETVVVFAFKLAGVFKNGRLIGVSHYV